MRAILPFCFSLSLLASSLGKNCSYGDVRLRGGTQFSGRVEVCANGTWGTICARGWDFRDAQVVCNQLNLSQYTTLPSTGQSVPTGQNSTTTLW